MNLSKDIRKLMKLSDGIEGKQYFKLDIKKINNKYFILFDNGEELEITEIVAKDIVDSVDPKDIVRNKNRITIKKMSFDKLADHSLFYLSYNGEKTLIYDDIE